MTDNINVIKLVGKTILGLLVLILILSSFGTVDAGFVGVKTRFSAVTGRVVEPGLFIKLPFIEYVVKINVQTQKEEANATAASKDLQNVTARVALNYSLDEGQIVNLYSNLGKDYKVRVIEPFIQEAVKATTSKFTAEELITKREIVSEDIKLNLSGKLIKLGINVEGLSIVNFDFSESFNVAIEAKVTAEQNALASKNKLEQIRYEAEQRVVQAKGEAEAIRIQANAITSQGGQEYVQLQAISKWDGSLPQYTGGGAIPFININ